MKIYNNPDSKQLLELLKRPNKNQNDLSALVQRVFDEVGEDGDTALLRLTSQYDKVSLPRILLNEDEVKSIAATIDSNLKDAIDAAYSNIKIFHLQQVSSENKVTIMEGVTCWREARPIDAVGLYIPGGSAPLFSTVLMLGVPAQIAECQEVVLCTPPNDKGLIHPAIAYAALCCGIKRIYRVGGIQAIAAMTFGTETVPKVYKIFGPGNQYVTAAKMAAISYGVAIDMPAGPSEVLVIADDTASPDFVASDLLAQAEHGPDSQAICCTTDMNLAELIRDSAIEQLAALPRKDIISLALQHSKIIVTPTISSCIDISNQYAPEHLILAVNDAVDLVPDIVNAGSVFCGHYTCESLGDYASGTNHTLPTNGYARNYSGVSLDSFIKKITFQTVDQQGMKYLGPIVEVMAEHESLQAHKQAVNIRLQAINKI